MSRKRIRAHTNPLSNDKDFPLEPSAVDWQSMFPGVENPTVTMADVGCGFGGLLVELGKLYTDRCILGLEIRDRVVEIDLERVAKLRAEYEAGKSTLPYNNISVVRANFMKSTVNYFAKHQLDAMFILFADPHFKKANHRRRVINRQLLDYYAYTLKPGSKLYTITDVADLHSWMVRHLEAHPLFERIPDEQLADDPCMAAIHNSTEEGKKVERLSGSKYPAVYRRLPDPEDD